VHHDAGVSRGPGRAGLTLREQPEVSAPIRARRVPLDHQCDRGLTCLRTFTSEPSIRCSRAGLTSPWEATNRNDRCSGRVLRAEADLGQRRGRRAEPRGSRRSATPSIGCRRAGCVPSRDRR
jgi:hypothetical protein